MSNASGVIWITGYSGAGKTTVGQNVEQMLRAQGHQVVRLDGDHLRAIFGGGWGYTKKDRIELAYVYFRLCQHLETQGLIVVISAVAMFAEVRAWVQDNITRSRVIYLDVPHDVRLARDATTKGVYASGADVESLYDEPTDPDLRIGNFGSTTPEESADFIVANFLAHHGAGRREW